MGIIYIVYIYTHHGFELFSVRADAVVSFEGLCNMKLFNVNYVYSVSLFLIYAHAFCQNLSPNIRTCRLTLTACAFLFLSSSVYREVLVSPSYILNQAEKRFDLAFLLWEPGCPSSISCGVFYCSYLGIIASCAVAMSVGLILE